MKKNDLEMKKFTPVYNGIDLELAVGIVFGPEVQPELIPGAILGIGKFPSWNLHGENGKLKKFYALRVKENSNSGGIELYAPFQKEEYAELILRRLSRQSKFLFGRRRERRPFSFSEDKNHLSLRIYRNSRAPEGWCFKPLFIRAENENYVYLIKLSADWLMGDRVRIVFLNTDKPPAFIMKDV